MLLMNLASETCRGVRIFLYCCLTSSRVIFVDIKKSITWIDVFCHSFLHCYDWRYLHLFSAFYVKWVVIDLYVNLNIDFVVEKVNF